MSDDEQKLLDECLNAESGLTGWELDFIESLDKIRNRDLSVKQRDRLVEIASDL